MHEENIFPGIEEAMDLLKQEGYKWEFEVKNNQLHLKRVDKWYEPEQVALVNFYRFHDEIDNDNIPLIYAIETTDNVQGFLIDFRGKNTEEIQAVVQKLKMKPNNQERDSKDVT